MGKAKAQIIIHKDECIPYQVMIEEVLGPIVSLIVPYHHYSKEAAEKHAGLFKGDAYFLTDQDWEIIVRPVKKTNNKNK